MYIGTTNLIPPTQSSDRVLCEVQIDSSEVFRPRRSSEFSIQFLVGVRRKLV